MIYLIYKKYMRLQTVKLKELGKQSLSLSLILLILLPTFFNILALPVYAASTPWAQTDWSGGSGQTSWSDATKFDSSSNIDTTTTSGQASLSVAEKLANSAFASNNTSWSVAAVPPSGWVEAPGNSTFSTTNFLVQKYEAKCAATSDLTTGLTTATNTYADSTTACTSANSRQVVSVASGNPIVNISQTTSATRCSAVSVGSTTAHLQTNNEWMSMTRDAEAQASNWNGGVVGTSYMYSGHNDNAPATSLVASSDDTLGYTNTGQSSGNQKRTLTLSNGAVLWDIPGNVWEWTNDTQSSTINTTAGWVEWNHANIASGARALYGPSSASYLSANGMGQVYGGALNNAFVRGGDWTSGAYTGAFTLYLFYTPSDTNSNVG